MAYGLLAGLEPIVGHYASAVPLVLYALFGSSRQLAVGPVAMVSLLVAAGVAPSAGGDPTRYAALAGLLAVRIDAPLFFANTAFLKQNLAAPEKTRVAPLRAVVLDAKAIGAVDATGVSRLPDLGEDWERRGVQLWVAGLRGPVADVLDRAGLLKRIGPHRLVHRGHEAVDAIEQERRQIAG